MNYWTGTEYDSLSVAIKAVLPNFYPKSYLEVGVDGGQSLKLILDAGKPKRIVLCDIWNPEYCTHGYSNHDHIIEMLARYNTDMSTVTFLDGDSKITVPAIKDKFDMITVDGDHSAEGALIDLNNCWPLLKSGGYLFFDDIGHLQYPWLKQTFNDWLPSDAIVIPETSGDATTAIVRKV